MGGKQVPRLDDRRVWPTVAPSDAGADFVDGLNVWGASGYNQFEMTPQGTYTMDGSLMSAILGVDHQGDTHVVGLALAYHGGGGDFGGIGKTEGSLGTNLYSVHPYVRLTFGEVFHVGGSFGLGTGDLSITDKDDKDGYALVETGVGMPVLAAVDARMELSLAEAWLLALQADGHLVQMVGRRTATAIHARWKPTPIVCAWGWRTPMRS